MVASVEEAAGWESRRVRVSISLLATVLPYHQYRFDRPTVLCCIGSIPFHLNPSCNRKNSRNAASFLNSPSFLHSAVCVSPLPLTAELFLLCGDNLLDDKQIWASRPSICRSPLRMRDVSREERLSKERERRDSIVVAPGGWDGERSTVIWGERPAMIYMQLKSNGLGSPRLMVHIREDGSSDRRLFGPVGRAMKRA